MNLNTVYFIKNPPSGDSPGGSVNADLLTTVYFEKSSIASNGLILRS